MSCFTSRHSIQPPNPSLPRKNVKLVRFIHPCDNSLKNPRNLELNTSFQSNLAVRIHSDLSFATHHSSLRSAFARILAASTRHHNTTP